MALMLLVAREPERFGEYPLMSNDVAWMAGPMAVRVSSVLEERRANEQPSKLHILGRPGRPAAGRAGVPARNATCA
jgi:hypothetical protein